SRAYARAHRSELDKAAGVIVFDAGTGKTTGFSLGGRKDLLAAGQRLLTPLTQFDATKLTTDMEWGTDHFDFMLEGVPTFVAEQEEANYLVNYHAVSDTYDKVDFPQLKKHVAEAATLSFELANLPERIGPRLTHAQIEHTIVQAILSGSGNRWVGRRCGSLSPLLSPPCYIFGRDTKPRWSLSPDT